MSDAATRRNEQDRIAQVLQYYLAGARSGRAGDMRPAFHKDATIFGHAGTDLFAGPIQQLFDWTEKTGPAVGLEACIASIDVFGTVASVRIELNDWVGNRFTDLFTLLQVDGAWKITNKVFHLHP